MCLRCYDDGREGFVSFADCLYYCCSLCTCTQRIGRILHITTCRIDRFCHDKNRPLTLENEPLEKLFLMQRLKYMDNLHITTSTSRGSHLYIPCRSICDWGHQAIKATLGIKVISKLLKASIQDAGLQFDL